MALVYERLFEDDQQDTCSGNCPTISTEQARDGVKSLKAFIDFDISDNEFQTETWVQNDMDMGTPPVYGDVLWYGFSVYVPAATEQLGDDHFQIVAQWHATPDNGDTQTDACLSLQIQGTNWEIINIVENTPSGSTDVTKNIYDTGVSVASTKDQWVDFVFAIRWDYDTGDGLIQAWLNNNQVLSLTGRNCFDDAEVPYFKYGMYNDWKNGHVGSARTTTVYHDDVRIANFADYNVADKVIVEPGRPDGPVYPDLEFFYNIDIGTVDLAKAWDGHNPVAGDYTVDQLPTGLSMDSNGQLTGTPVNQVVLHFNKDTVITTPYGPSIDTEFTVTYEIFVETSAVSHDVIGNSQWYIKHRNPPDNDIVHKHWGLINTLALNYQLETWCTVRVYSPGNGNPALLSVNGGADVSSAIGAKNNTTGFLIGNRDGAAVFFKGFMREVKFYAGEEGNGGTLVAYYPINDYSDTIKDVTGITGDGTLAIGTGSWVEV